MGLEEEYLMVNIKEQIFDVKISVVNNRSFVDITCLEDLYPSFCWAIIKDFQTNLGIHSFSFDSKKGLKFWGTTDFEIDRISGVVFEIYHDGVCIFRQEDPYFPIKTQFYQCRDLKIFSGDMDLGFTTFLEIFVENNYTKDRDVKESDIVVDFGANIGLFSLYSLMHKCSKIYSVEPCKKTFSYLEKNLSLFKDKTELFNMAIGSYNGTIELRTDDFRSTMNTSNSMFKENFQEKVGNFVEEEVEIVDVNDFLKYKVKENKINFLKIDIEGSEYDVLDKMDEYILKNRIEHLLVEYHFLQKNMGVFLKIVEKLKRCGFECFFNISLDTGMLIAKNKKNLNNEQIVFERYITKNDVKLVHLLCVPTDKREQNSVKFLFALKDHGLKYVQHFNDPCKIYPIDIPSYTQYDIKNPGHWGNYTAFKKAILTEFDTEFLLLCECDCMLEILPNEFVFLMDSVCDIMKKENIYCVSFGDTRECNTGNLVSWNTGSIPGVNFMYLTNNIICCHCVIFRKSVKEFLYSSFERSKWDPIDLYFNEIFNETNYKRAVLTRRVAKQHDGMSLMDHCVKNFDIIYDSDNKDIINFYFNQVFDKREEIGDNIK